MLFQTDTVAAALVSLAVPIVLTGCATEVDEQKLDNLASAYEDLSSALAGVEDMTDADLVAARVAVDFLLLRDLDAALRASDGMGVDHASVRSFVVRCTEAARTTQSAMEHLRQNSCFESDALQAALSLAILMSDPDQKSQILATSAKELVANNKEMVILLLDEAVDEVTAPQVAVLVQAALVYGTSLASFAEEQGDELLSIEQKDEFSQRLENFAIDFAEQRSRLSVEEYFGSKALRSLFEQESVVPASLEKESVSTSPQGVEVAGESGVSPGTDIIR